MLNGEAMFRFGRTNEVIMIYLDLASKCLLFLSYIIVVFFTPNVPQKACTSHHKRIARPILPLRPLSEPMLRNISAGE